MTDQESTPSENPPPVAGYLNGIFTRDMEGAMAAVIVNPLATPAQRLAWTMGQLELLKMVADVANDGASSALAVAVRQLVEQSVAVLQGVLDDLERPPETMMAAPLRVV